MRFDILERTPNTFTKTLYFITFQREMMPYHVSNSKGSSHLNFVHDFIEITEAL